MRLTAKGFLDYCSQQALTPCFYSCTDELWPMLHARGFRRVVGGPGNPASDQGFGIQGQGVAERQNVPEPCRQDWGSRPNWGRYAELPHGVRAQVSEVSEEWAAQKKIPEMGFTMGGLDELDDEDVLCCVAVDGTGFVYGVTSWLPVYEDGAVVSWTLDFMRRRGDAFPGVMEFLIASAVLHLRDSVEVISLSGSPLAREEGEIDQRSKGLAGILEVVGQALEPVYGFRSLASFKSQIPTRVPNAIHVLPGPAASSRNRTRAQPGVPSGIVSPAFRAAAPDSGWLNCQRLFDGPFWYFFMVSNSRC